MYEGSSFHCFEAITARRRTCGFGSVRATLSVSASASSAALSVSNSSRMPESLFCRKAWCRAVIVSAAALRSLCVRNRASRPFAAPVLAMGSLSRNPATSIDSVPGMDSRRRAAVSKITARTLASFFPLPQLLEYRKAHSSGRTRSPFPSGFPRPANSTTGGLVGEVRPLQSAERTHGLTLNVEIGILKCGD